MMEGLLDRGAPGPADQGNEPSASEQAQRSGIMLAAGKAMYGKEGFGPTVDLLGQGGDPVENAARGTAFLMHAISKSLAKAGKQISDDALLDAGREVLERMIGIAVETGVVPGDEASTKIEKAEELALAIYDQLESGQGQPQGGQPDGRIA